MVRDVQNSTSRAAAKRLVGSSCMGVPSDSFLYRATKPPATICCRHFWRNLTLIPWPKNWVIQGIAWLGGTMSHLKLKKMYQYNWKFFHYVVLAILMSLWLLIPHQTPQRETSFAFGGCRNFWKHTEAHRWWSTTSPRDLCVGPSAIGWSFMFMCCINIAFSNTLVELADPVCSLSPLCWVDLLPHFGYAVTRQKCLCN